MILKIFTAHFLHEFIHRANRISCIIHNIANTGSSLHDASRRPEHNFLTAVKLMPDTVFGPHAAAALVAFMVVLHHIDELIKQIMHAL